jgi:hypothetical protein
MSEGGIFLLLRGNTPRLTQDQAMVVILGMGMTDMEEGVGAHRIHRIRPISQMEVKARRCPRIISLRVVLAVLMGAMVETIRTQTKMTMMRNSDAE